MTYLNRGKAHDLLGQRELALADYRTVLKRRDVWGLHDQAKELKRRPYKGRRTREGFMKRTGLALCITALSGLLWGAEPFDVAVPGFSEKDDLILQGDYTAPASSSSLVLVCLHGLGSSRGEWAPLIRQGDPTRDGVLVAYDLRGHGNSRGTMAGNTVNHEDP
jgi:hypothetical protein